MRKKNLLILACSDRKLKQRKLMPAIERYDGVNYRVIKKLKQRGSNLRGLDIIIISAKYGLLTQNSKIGYYDQKMTEKRAIKLNETIPEELQEIVKKKAYGEIFINLGSDYLRATAGTKDLIRKVSPNTQIVFAYGRIGERMKQMKEWIVKVCPG